MHIHTTIPVGVGYDARFGLVFTITSNKAP